MTAPSEERTVAQQQTIGSHSPIAVVLHWGFRSVFLQYAITKQIDELDELEDFSLLQNEMIFASVFLALLFARFLYMRLTRPTVLPSDTPRIEMLMAQSVSSRHVHKPSNDCSHRFGHWWNVLVGYQGWYRNAYCTRGARVFCADKLSSNLFAYFSGSLSPPKRRWYLECYGTLLLEGDIRFR